MDDSLSFESFLEGAKKVAHKAMEDHGRRDYDEFALHAGVAVERLGKAALVVKNPAYLAEVRNGSPEMLLYLGGHLKNVGKVRTIGARDTIDRLRRLDVLPSDPQLDLLIEIRNGVAHTTSGDEAKELLPVFARTVDELITHLAVDMEEFWGRWTHTVTVAVTERENQVLRDVQIRIAQARHAFDDRFVGLPEDVKERVLAGYQHEPAGSAGPLSIGAGDPVTVAVECPACTGPGGFSLVLGERTGMRTTFVPDAFACRFCNLEVRGAEEMAALRRTVAGRPSTPMADGDDVRPVFPDVLVFRHLET